MPPPIRGKSKARAVRDPTMEPTGPMPMAVLGHSLFLPQGIHGGEKLFELVRAKRQVTTHREEINYPPKMIMDTTGDGSSWKYRVDYGNYFTKDEVMDVDKKLFRIGEKEAQFMQQPQCWTLEAVFRAIENAGLKLEQLQGTRTGVFIAGFTNMPQLRTAPDETSIRGSPLSSMADKVAFYLGTHGPSMTTETACSSSLTVLSQAVSFIRKGDCDTAIVVGCCLRSWADYLVQMQALGVMSPRGLSSPFDEVADGMGRAEAYGCMIIRRMDLAEMAQDNILATLVNACAGHAGPEDDVIEGSGRVYEAPCALGINKIIRLCYEQANVPMEHVRYIEAHATGTPVGDLIELEGISRALRDHHHAVYNPIRVASVKGNVGHAEVAAGMISLVKVMGMLKHKVFLPSGGLSKPRQDFDWVANAMVPMADEEPFPEHEPVYIGINSFGLGGAYGHAILTPYKPHTAFRPRPMLPLPSPRSLTAHDDQEAYHILPFSAASEAHLALYESALADYLESHGTATPGGVAEEAKSVDGKLLSLSSPSSASSLSSSRRPVSPAQLLRDVCGTMWCHRSSMRYRRAYVASDVSSLVTQLRSESKESSVSVVDPAMSKKDASNGVALVFTGQGAQWKGCGDRLVNRFPVYRRAVEAVDAIFTKVAGWSLRERAATLSKEELMQTQYAQPFTFMVQVGLTELIKSFNLRVTVAVGHSAGEVPAAYAAGKLSLEQAVKLVYHRSQLQQQLAGSGRMLVVGLSASETAAVLDKAGRVAAHVYVACLNSAQSTVLAGREVDLRRVEDLLPDGTFKAWVAGNIAFHCPLVEPILQDMHTQLSPFLPTDPVQEPLLGGEEQKLSPLQFLSKLKASGSERQEESDVTFISTVTGGVYEGPVSPAYWLRNVREAVQFQGAAETLLRLPDCPKYVLEVGPHKTLLAPLLQTAQAVGGDKGFTAALSTLKRGEADDAMFMHMLAKLFEAGMYTLSLDRWFRRDEDFHLLRDMPGHPMIKKPLFQGTEDPSRVMEEQKLTGFSCGPTAGQYQGPSKLQAIVEVSDQNLPKMAEHVMGGTPMLPGTFFVVAAIETLGGVPCTMTDVNMLNTCKIPRGLEPRCWLSTQLEKVATAPDDAYHFTVATVPHEEFTMENVTASCMGRIFRNPDILEALNAKTEEGEGGENKDETPQLLDVETYGMDKYCMQAQLNLKDIGHEGIELLKAQHPVVVAKDNKEVYQIINIDGVRHWGPSFALAQNAHMSNDRRSLLAMVKSDCKGEYYTPQLLDCFVHLGILSTLSDPSIVTLHGGFERAHFVRVPGPGDLYVHTIFKPVVGMGRIKRATDIHVFDSEGRIIMWLEGGKAAFGGDKSSIKLAEMHWQPYSSTVNAQEVQAAAKTITELKGPPKHCHDAMAELVSSVGLSKAGRVVGETPDGSCVGVRVLLECNNDDCATLSQALLDALAEHDGLCKGDVIVELYTILRKPSLLAALDLKVASGAASWLRYRRVVLPLGLEQLGDMAFDVIITSHIMQPPTQELQEAEDSGKQQDKATKLQDKKEEEARVDETLTSLLTLACPGAVVLVHVHEPVKEKEEEEDKKDGEADEPSATAGAGAEATPEGTPEGTPEADVMEASGSVETKDETAVQSTALATATEEKADLFELREPKQVSGEEKPEVKAPPVMLVLPPALRRACFHADEEVSTVGGDDGTLFVGRAPVPPIVRLPVANKTTPQDQAQEDRAESDAEQTSLQTQGEGETSAARRELLLVADSAELAEQMKAQLLSTSSSQAVDDVHVLLCGPGSGLPLLNESDEERQQASEKTVVKAWMDALREQVGPLACREIIFLAGMTDESPVAAVGYYRLLRLAKAIAKLQTPPQPQKEEEQQQESESTDGTGGAEEEKAEKTEEEDEEEPDVPGMEGSEEFEGPKVLWVVTKGCFNKHGVVIGQASLYAAARNLEVEVDDMAVRIADLADLQCLPRLASLVASQPRERYFRVDHQGDVLVQRFFVHTLGKTINTVNLSADDPHMAYGICLPYDDVWAIPGQVTVDMRAWPVPPPGDDEVTVRVHSAGVNFRDALMAMSLMPVESFENSCAGKCLGLESAGTVVAVGKNVTDLKPGQPVWTSASNSFCSLINAPKKLTYALPDKSTFAQGATCQVAYVTAYRGLVHMAHVKKGETVLVHAAAGGVGMAAVSICQAFGATVYATASAGKRKLVEQWGVDPSHIFDSRSYTWFKDVMRATKGQGVDIVFNSLTGKHQKLGMEALRSQGRFVEIGKVDVYRNAPIGLMAMARNCQFIMVDCDELGKSSANASGDASAKDMMDLLAKVATGEFKALPCTTYAMSAAEEAMDHMKTGKHTGKIMLTNYEDSERMVKPRRVQASLDHQRCCYKSEGVYLVTGAGGGFGSRIVRSAVMLGARTFVVSLTRDAESRVQALFGDLLQQHSDLTIHAVTADLSVKDDVARLVAVCRSLDQPLRSIIHCAGNPFDKTLHQLKRGDLEKLAGPKNMCAWWLHEMTLDMKSIENFAVVSSVAADLAARGFLVYAPTNAMLNSFVRYRQSLGLPACALNMATLCDVGIVADKPAVRQMQTALGVEMLTSARACRDLIEVMMSGRQLLQLQLRQTSWSAIAHTFCQNVTTTLTLGAQEEGERRLAPEEALDFILQTVRDITRSDDVMPGDTLAGVSIDSLSLMDLTSRVKRATGVDLPLSKLKATSSIAEVADLVAERMRAMQGIAAAAATAVQESSDVVAWVEQRVEEEVQKEEKRAKRRSQMASQPSFSVFEDETRAAVAMASEQKQDHVDSCLPLKFWRRKAKKGSSGDSSTEEDSVITSSTSSSLTEETDEMTPLKARQWFKTQFPNKNAERRLLVIPAAGRGTQQYGMWMLPGVEIVAVQIPGKAGREDEAPTMNLVEWGGKIARAAVFAGLLDDNKPLSVLGHSSGSVLALETCRALQKHYDYTAQHLFVCSLQAPHLMSDLPGPLKKFFYKCCFNKTGVQTMIWMAGGTSRPVFLDKRSQQFIDGLWKQGGAVKEYSETHTLPLPAEDVLACPITVMWGEHDIVSNPKFGKRWWRDWDGYSQHKIRMLSFQGHHFFPFQPKLTPHVLQAILDTIAPTGESKAQRVSQ